MLLGQRLQSIASFSVMKFLPSVQVFLEGFKERQRLLYRVRLPVQTFLEYDFPRLCVLASAGNPCVLFSGVAVIG